MIVTRQPYGPFRAVEVARTPWWIGGTTWAVVDAHGHLPAEVVADAIGQPVDERWCRRRAADLNSEFYAPALGLIAGGPD